MKRAFSAVVATLLAIGTTGPGMTSVTSLPQTPVSHWSVEAQRRIVPPPAGVGNKFPGEAAEYMGIVHIAIHDAVVAIQGSYRPYTIRLTAPAETRLHRDRSSRNTVAPVAALPPAEDLEHRYAEYVSKLPNDTAKTNGIAVGQQIAAAVVALRANEWPERGSQVARPARR